MRYNRTVEARFVSRPNRFIAQVELAGKIETVHVKNTGRCRELLAMDEFGVPREYVFADKQSGKDFDRPAYQDLLGRLSVGDTLVVNIKTRYLIQSYLWVQSSKSIATRGFGDFAFWGVRHRSIK